MRPLAASVVRAAVVDDLHLVCSGLTHVLRQAGASTVAACNSREAARSIDVEHCELVLIGPHLVVPASVVVRRLKGRGFHGLTVHLPAVMDRSEFVELLRCGVDAFAPFSASQAELTSVLQRAMEGERIYDGVVLGAVRPALGRGGTDIGLSAREREVLALLATRRTMAEIAAELFISVSTVKCHAASVYAKLGVRSRADAVDQAFAHAVLDAV